MANRRIAEAGIKTRFPKGKSGNPGGRPKKLSEETAWFLGQPCRIPAIIKAYEKQSGDRVDPVHPPTNAEIIAARIVYLAETASVKQAHTYFRLAQEILDKQAAPTLSSRIAFLLSLNGPAGTDAVTGRTIDAAIEKRSQADE